MPNFSHDDYLNFLVTEALVARGEVDREKAEKQQKRADFRGSHKDFDPMKESGSG